MSQEQAAPGWYLAAPGVERWWDGSQWTDTVRAVPQPAPVVVQQPSMAITSQPVQTSHTFHLLMTLLTCGLWGIFVWLPISIINSMSRKKVVTRYR